MIQRNRIFWQLASGTALVFWQTCSSNGQQLAGHGAPLLSEAPFRMLHEFMEHFSHLQCIHSYLQNGNILAARTFITHFTSALPKDLQISSVAVGSSDEIILTKDPVVNFTQIAVLTCQRAQGEKSKVMRESWIRLCGTYQSRGGVLAASEVRKVNIYCRSRFFGSQFLPPQRHSTN